MNRILVFICILMAIAAACKKEPKNPPAKTTEPTKWYGRIKMIVHENNMQVRDTNFYYYDDKGFCIKQIIDGYAVEFIYAEHFIKAKSNYPGNELYSTTYYISNGNRVDSIYEDYKYSNITINEYDINGNLAGYIKYNLPSRMPMLKYEYKWTNGNLESYKVWDDPLKMIPSAYVNRTFDMSKSNTIKIELPWLNNDKNLVTTHDLQYTDPQMAPVFMEYSYVFDSVGNVLSRSVMNNGKFSWKDTYVYE